MLKTTRMFGGVLQHLTRIIISMGVVLKMECRNEPKKQAIFNST